MHTTMRSQDLWLGFCYDIFTATILQELLAGWLGAGLGSYRLCVDSLHLYDHDIPQAQQLPASPVPGPLMAPLATPWETFDELLAAVISGTPGSEPGWAELACVLASYRARKAGDREAAAAGCGQPRRPARRARWAAGTTASTETARPLREAQPMKTARPPADRARACAPSPTTPPPPSSPADSSPAWPRRNACPGVKHTREYPAEAVRVAARTTRA